MSPLGIFSIFSRLASIYALFAALVLSTLWVSSLTLASTPTNATDLITDAGVHVLNPFLVAQSPKVGLQLGISQAEYTSLQAQKGAQLTLPAPFNAAIGVPSSDIAGKPYDVGVQNIYQRVASAYYAGGVESVFQVNLPSELQSFVPNFGLLNPNNVPIEPGAPAPSQLPTVLQPLFTVIGLTPDTFTAAGHQNLLNLLPFFWLATLVTGVIAFLLKRSQDGQKLSGIAHSIIHTTWPIVAILLGLLIVAPHIGAISGTVAPFEDMLGVISRSFLPVYGGALVVGLIALFLPKILANRASKATTEPTPVVAGAGAAPLRHQAESPLGPMPSMPTSAAPVAPIAPAAPSAESDQSAAPLDSPPTYGTGEP